MAVGARPMKMKTKTKSAAESLITTVAAAAALILLNVLSCGSHKKIDLTEQKIYTLSDGSRDLVSQLPERLLVKAYFGNIPAEHAEKQEYVENLLTEYAGASNGKLAWEKVDFWK